MSGHAQSAQFDDEYMEGDAGFDAAAAERARPIPRISIQAFCDDPHSAEVLQYAPPQ